MPTQLIYTVVCPICGSVAGLHVAHGLPDRKKPVVASFDCPHSRHHANPTDDHLLTLPARLIATIADYPNYLND